jgi:hypothetical protein
MPTQKHTQNATHHPPTPHNRNAHNQLNNTPTAQHQPTPPFLNASATPTLPPITRCLFPHPVYPKRHRRTRLAPLRALGMPPHHKHKKHPLAPAQPTTQTQHLHRQPHRTPTHRQRHLSPARALAPSLLGRPPLVALHARTPPTRSGFRGQVAPARVFARAHTTNRVRQVQLPQRFGIAPPVAYAQQQRLRTPCRVEPRAYRSDARNPAFYLRATGGGVGIACLLGEGGQAVEGHTAGVGFGSCSVEGCVADELLDVVQ